MTGLDFDVEVKGSVVKIKAPWGDFVVTTKLGFYKQCAAQLQYYLDSGQSPNAEYTREDLAGYKLLIKLGCEETAKLFSKIKSLNLSNGIQMTNMEIIRLLQEQGKWGYRK